MKTLIITEFINGNKIIHVPSAEEVKGYTSFDEVIIESLEVEE